VVTLTSFAPQLLHLADVSFLASLVQLVRLRLNCHDAVDVSLLMSAIAQCRRIHTLQVAHIGLNDGHLCVLLPSLPRIRDLTIDSDTLTDLSFASHVSHLSLTLESLTLRHGKSLSLVETHHLRSLRNLRRLEFHHTFKSALDEHTRACFTPSSACFLRSFWPHLVHFHCAP
jgi:hypothetical protein